MRGRIAHAGAQGGGVGKMQKVLDGGANVEYDGGEMFDGGKEGFRGNDEARFRKRFQK